LTNKSIGTRICLTTIDLCTIRAKPIVFALTSDQNWKKTRNQ